MRLVDDDDYDGDGVTLVAVPRFRGLYAKKRRTRDR